MRIILGFFISLVTLQIISCNDKDRKEEKSKLSSHIIDSMITVDGGRYQMGDFGPLVGEKLPFSPDVNNKPLHWVELNTFRMASNRVTWEEFNKWLKFTSRDKNDYYMSERFKKPTGDKYPAVASWKDASDFCHWVGNVTGKKVALPTEAQWEYAARSRGQFRQFANSDNVYDLSVPDSKLNFTHDHPPVGTFSPNPLGLYDMMGNGHDWVNDWYAEDYYQHSPEKDPQGPTSGTEKVVRGYLDQCLACMISREGVISLRQKHQAMVSVA